MIFFGFYITIILIILGILAGKSKVVLILDAIWMWILLGCNIGGADYAANKLIFQNVTKASSGSSIIKYGINYFIVSIFQKLSLSYNAYIMIMSIFTVLIICIIIYKDCDYPATALSFFMIYPLFDSVIQKRYFLAMVMCLIAFHFWLKNQKILYYLFVLLSINFHVSTIIYLIFPIMLKILKGKRKWLVIPIILAMTLFLKNPSFIVQILNPSLVPKFETYSKSMNYSSYLVAIMYILLEASIIFTMYFGIDAKENTPAGDKLLRNWNLTSALFLPLLLTDSIYLRWYRLINIYNYMYVAKNLRTIKNRSLVRYHLLFIFCLIIVFQGLMSYVNPNVMNSVFKNNSFLIWLFS